MWLKEFEGKKLLRDYGIPVPTGQVATLENLERLKGIKDEKEYILKAQAQTTGRKKAGLIQHAKGSKLKGKAKSLLSKKEGKFRITEVLIEEKIGIEKEYYIAVALDNLKKEFVLLFCEEGGLEIESIRDKIKKFGIKDNKPAKIGNKEIDFIAERLWQLARDFDALTAEINPLALANSRYIALDAKIIIDDNARFRHPEIKTEEQFANQIEKKARLYGLQHVDLGGNIGIIGNGAGLVLSSLDCIAQFGGKPANFLDLGGGASVLAVERALELVLMKKPKAILMNIFGGITRCDEIAQGIVNYKNRKGIKAPIIVRMIGTNDREGRNLLEQNGIRALDSMEECARQAVACTE